MDVVRVWRRCMGVCVCACASASACACAFAFACACMCAYCVLRVRLLECFCKKNNLIGLFLRQMRLARTSASFSSEKLSHSVASDVRTQAPSYYILK